MTIMMRSDMNADLFVRTELDRNQGMTVVDLTAHTPVGMSRDSVRLAVLHMLNSGEVDVSLDQKLTLTEATRQER
jgi:hypothetical protein